MERGGFRHKVRVSAVKKTRPQGDITKGFLRRREEGYHRAKKKKNTNKREDSKRERNNGHEFLFLLPYGKLPIPSTHIPQRY